MRPTFKNAVLHRASSSVTRLSATGRANNPHVLRVERRVAQELLRQLLKHCSFRRRLPSNPPLRLLNPLPTGLSPRTWQLPSIEQLHYPFPAARVAAVAQSGVLARAMIDAAKNWRSFRWLSCFRDVAAPGNGRLQSLLDLLEGTVEQVGKFIAGAGIVHIVGGVRSTFDLVLLRREEEGGVHFVDFSSPHCRDED